MPRSRLLFVIPLIGVAAYFPAGAAEQIPLPLPMPMPKTAEPAAPPVTLPPPVASAAGDAPAAEACAPAGQACGPLCGPRIRVVVPRPIITFRKICSAPEEPTCAVSAPTCAAGCAAPGNFGGDGFGAAPSRPVAPTMTTIHVPYTYMVPVPTFAVMPQTSSFGFGASSSAGFGAGFGAVPVGGFGGVSQFGTVGQFGGVPAGLPAGNGFGAAGNSSNDVLLRAIVAAVMKKDGGFGAAPEADDCKKDLAAMNAKIELLRADLADFARTTRENDGKVKEAIVKLSEKLVIVNDKLGDTKDGKTLAATIAELDERITALKKNNPTLK